jgi:hypothetical protein
MGSPCCRCADKVNRNTPREHILSHLTTETSIACLGVV